MELLTPFQQRFLTALGKNTLANHFYLTGGTALSAFYLAHRFSADLDFFTDNPQNITSVPIELQQIASQLDAKVEFVRTYDTLIQCFLENEKGERVELDFAHDSPFRFQPTIEATNYRIQLDNLVDIATNKLSALFGRAEPKDFVDVYFICQEWMGFDELFTLTQEKHLGMSNYWMAVALRRVQNVTLLPRMIKPVTIEQLHDFFLPIAQRLLDAVDE